MHFFINSGILPLFIIEDDFVMNTHVRPSLKCTQLFFGIVVFLFVIAFLFVPVAHVFAQSGDTYGLAQVDQTIGLGNADIRIIIGKIIRAVLGLLGVISLGMILYAGFSIMTSGGEEDKIATGRKTLINATIGLGIILSAMIIVQFVLNALNNAINNGGGGRDTPAQIVYDSFGGSGALGNIVKDHYPMRDQTGVKRGISIAVTFREPMYPASIIENSNNSCWGDDGLPTTTCKFTGADQDIPYYGDCLMDKEDFDWARDCDHLITNAVAIHALDDAGETVGDPVQTAVMTIYQDGDARHAYSFVFKPINPPSLGDDTENVRYEVTLTNTIKKDNENRTDAFERGLYRWKFETDTTFDFDPPYVVSITPQSGETVFRNDPIQIHFNEAMNPMVVQGLIGPTSEFIHIIFGRADVTGEWRVANGYKSIEFLSDQVCGQNSCGDPLYCLPTTCETGDTACTDNFQVLARTADLVSETQKTFEALPFSGVMDISGNALDNGPDNIHDGVLARPHKPSFESDGKTIGDNETVPDNFSWAFKVKNQIDRRAPYIVSITPGVDAEGVPSDGVVSVLFPTPMTLDSLYDIDLQEYPNTLPNGNILEFGHWPDVELLDNRQTLVTLHGTHPFGPNDVDYYYFPIVPSTVKSSKNCFYPGQGPNTTATSCSVTYADTSGELSETTGCIVGSSFNNNTDTACVTRNSGVPTAQPNVSTCTGLLQTDDVSPVIHYTVPVSQGNPSGGDGV